MFSSGFCEFTKKYESLPPYRSKFKLDAVAFGILLLLFGRRGDKNNVRLPRNDFIIRIACCRAGQILLVTLYIFGINGVCKGRIHRIQRRGAVKPGKIRIYFKLARRVKNSRFCLIVKR